MIPRVTFYTEILSNSFVNINTPTVIDSFGGFGLPQGPRNRKRGIGGKSPSLIQYLRECALFLEQTTFFLDTVYAPLCHKYAGAYDSLKAIPRRATLNCNDQWKWSTINFIGEYCWCFNFGIRFVNVRVHSSWTFWP